MLGLPLLAVGPDLVPVLERCVRGTVVSGGERRRSMPEELPRIDVGALVDAASGGNSGLARLRTTTNAIETGRKLAGFSCTERALDRQRPLSELAAEFGLSLNEARMAIRLFVANEKGLVNPLVPLSQAEREAGIRDYFGNIVEDFR